MYEMDAVYMEYQHCKCLSNTYRMTVPANMPVWVGKFYQGTLLEEGVQAGSN